MKALTDEAFEDYLDEEISWRRAELQLLKSDVRTSSGMLDTPRSRASARALSVMIYAHWEGYVKNTFDKLAEAISRRRPPLAIANDDLVMAHMRHLLDRLRSGDPAASEAMISIARGSDAPRLKLKRDELVRTHDNLRYEYLAAILQNFGISIKDFELSERFIDQSVCERRNMVAHGRSSFPRSDQVVEAADKIIDLMTLLRTLQVALLANREYLVPEAADSGVKH